MTALSPREFSLRQPESLFVLPIGVGNAFSTRFYGASFLVMTGGVVTLVDAPGPLGKALHEALAKAGLRGDIGSIDNVFLTHLHGDHCNGIEEMGFWRFFVPGSTRPRLFLRRELVTPLWEQRLVAAMGSINVGGTMYRRTLADYFDIHPFDERDSINLHCPGLTAETFPTRHGIPTSALRLLFHGNRLGYSADTPFDPELLEFLAESDFLIHEVSASEIHTPYESLVALPETLRSRIRLIHLSDSFSIPESIIPALEEGRIYEVTKT